MLWPGGGNENRAFDIRLRSDPNPPWAPGPRLSTECSSRIGSKTRSMKKGQSPHLNPDGVSVHGCSIIYAPAGQAGEDSALATNPYRGCGHKCGYCYVPRQLRMLREGFDA